MDILSHRAGKLIAQKRHGRAAVRLSLLAPEALAARRKADGRAARADGDPLNVFADFHDVAAEFMAENGSFVPVLFIPVKVGAAYAAGVDFNNDAVGSADGIGDRFGSNILRAAQDCCFHFALRKF